MSALLAGLGGVIMASQLKSGSATTGTSTTLHHRRGRRRRHHLSGGEGMMLGTRTGAFTIAVTKTE